MRGLDLGDTTSTVDKGSKKTNKAMVADTTKVLEFVAGKEVGRIRTKRDRRRTGAIGRKIIRWG